MKIFLATCGSEIDFFSPIPTSLESFRACCLERPPFDPHDANWALAPQKLFRALAEERGWQVIDGLCAMATPAAPPPAALHESLRDEILADLARAMPVDAVLYHLHGAFCAEGYDDCEGDLLARTRAATGPDVPIGALFDLHAHLTQQMIDNADVLVGLKEFPHVDYAERSRELFALIADTALGAIRPVMSLFDCRMIGAIHTTRPPMRGFVDEMKRLEGRDGVLSITANHGFAKGDMPDMGTSLLVVTDDHPRAGAALARRLGETLFAMRDAVVTCYQPVESGVARALAARDTGRPVVIADTADNAGGGAPSDSTLVLRSLIEQGADNAALAYLWDPVAVSIAQASGVGTRRRMRIGGKTPISGEPVDVDAEITALVPDFQQRAYGGEVRVAVGDCAAVRASGIDIVLSTLREQPLSLDAFTAFGIDPRKRDILVVKSTQHFHAAFAPIAGEILYVDANTHGTPGSELLDRSYRRIRRPKWPFDPDPFAAP